MVLGCQTKFVSILIACRLNSFNLNFTKILKCSFSKVCMLAEIMQIHVIIFIDLICLIVNISVFMVLEAVLNGQQKGGDLYHLCHVLFLKQFSVHQLPLQPMLLLWQMLRSLFLQVLNGHRVL